MKTKTSSKPKTTRPSAKTLWRTCTRGDWMHSMIRQSQVNPSLIAKVDYAIVCLALRLSGFSDPAVTHAMKMIKARMTGKATFADIWAAYGPIRAVSRHAEKLAYGPEGTDAAKAAVDAIAAVIHLLLRADPDCDANAHVANCAVRACRSAGMSDVVISTKICRIIRKHVKFTTVSRAAYKAIFGRQRNNQGNE